MMPQPVPISKSSSLFEVLTCDARTIESMEKRYPLCGCNTVSGSQKMLSAVNFSNFKTDVFDGDRGNLSVEIGKHVLFKE